LKDAWKRTTEREKNIIPLSKMLDLHYELATKHKMRVPIDPKNLAQMIHPHYGYLTHMPVLLYLTSRENSNMKTYLHFTRIS